MLFNQFNQFPSLDTTPMYVPTTTYASTALLDITKEALEQNNKDKYNIIELKEDIEKLLNIYIDNRKMTKKECKYFSNKYQDIINKKSALKTLENRIKGDKY